MSQTVHLLQHLAYVYYRCNSLDSSQTDIRCIHTQARFDELLLTHDPSELRFEFILNSLNSPDRKMLMCRWDFWNEHEEWMGGESCKYYYQFLLILQVTCNLWLPIVDPDPFVTAGCIHLGNIWQYSWSCAAVSGHHLVCSMEAFVVHSRCYILQQRLAKVTALGQYKQLQPQMPCTILGTFKLTNLCYLPHVCMQLLSCIDSVVSNRSISIVC